MISIQTRRVGMSEVSEAAALEFPLGLPGFEWSRRFAVVEQPEFRPSCACKALIPRTVPMGCARLGDRSGLFVGAFAR